MYSSKMFKTKLDADAVVLSAFMQGWTVSCHYAKLS